MALTLDKMIMKTTRPHKKYIEKVRYPNYVKKKFKKKVEFRSRLNSSLNSTKFRDIFYMTYVVLHLTLALLVTNICLNSLSTISDYRMR